MSRAYARAVAKHESQDRLRLERSVHTIAASDDLRYFLFAVLEHCGMAADPFTGDPLTTAHNCGKMAVGASLLALINDHDPDLYPALLKEMQNERRTRDAELAERSDRGNDPHAEYT